MSFNSSKRESSRKCILFDSNRLLRVVRQSSTCRDAATRWGDGAPGAVGFGFGGFRGGVYRGFYRWFRRTGWCLCFE